LFHVGRDSPDLYEKTIDCLAQYASTQFKNGRDVVLCIHSKEYVGPEVQKMNANPTTNDKRVVKLKSSEFVYCTYSPM